MTIRFQGADPREMLSHHLLYGAGALCEAAGVPDVRLWWSDEMGSRPHVDGAGLTPDVLAEIVHEHTRRAAEPSSWLHAPLPVDPKRALMSPRVGSIGDDRTRWEAVQRARHRVEDDLAASGDELALALVGALGEPSYWRRHPRTGQRLQDDGASRLEMQPRNQGSEFVGSRLRGLASAVAARSVEGVRDGLLGRTVIDEMGGGASDSRSATNLRPLGPTDNAVAWVALWGFSQVPVVHHVHERSRTATHVPGNAAHRAGSFALPLWTQPWHPAKLRSVLASAELSEVLVDAVPPERRNARGSGDPGTAQGRRDVLERRRGVRAVAVFSVGIHGSTSAPERRVDGGSIVVLAEAPATTPGTG